MKKKHIWVFLLVIIIFGFIGYSFLKYNNSSVEEKKDREHELHTQLIQSGKSAEGDNYYVIGYSGKVPSSLPSRYILEDDYYIRSRTLGRNDRTGLYVFQKDMDRFLFHIYSIENGEKIKTLDIKQLFEDNCPMFQLVSLNSYHIMPYRNEPCIGFEVEKRPDFFEDGLEDTYKRVYLNIETEKLQVLDYSREQWEIDRLRRSDWSWKNYIFKDPEYSLLELNGMKTTGVSNLNFWDGVSEIYLPLHELPVENERLYGIFPQLKEKVKEEKEKPHDNEDDVLYIAIYLVDYSTPEEIVSMLLPEGQEISFEGMGISHHRSIDGEAHEVSSFEEYQQYLKPNENPVDESNIHPYFKPEGIYSEEANGGDR